VNCSGGLILPLSLPIFVRSKNWLEIPKEKW
jgi:hypothetical protein